MRFNDFVSRMKEQLKSKAHRSSYAQTLDEHLSEAIKEENWPLAEALAAGMLALDKDSLKPR